MNVVTKLLIENETDISTFEVRRIGEEPSQKNSHYNQKYR